jgi:hypothetical protein
MWTELNLEQMEREENAGAGVQTPEQVEQIVVMARLELYNRDLPCGATALRQRLDQHYHLRPLPSARTIGRILARNGLTHGRTGWYDGDDPDDVPDSAKRHHPRNRGGVEVWVDSRSPRTEPLRASLGSREPKKYGNAGNQAL